MKAYARSGVARKVRPLGFEPRTCGLRVRCSAVELEARCGLRRIVVRRERARFKPRDGVSGRARSRQLPMSRRARWCAALAAVVVALSVQPAAVAPALSANNLCQRFGPGSVTGHVQNKRLTEISGVAASRRYPGVYWTHNDSGGKPEVFAFTLDGTDLGSYALTGASAVDWEDIAVGPKHGAAGSYIY